MKSPPEIMLDIASKCCNKCKYWKNVSRYRILYCKLLVSFSNKCSKLRACNTVRFFIYTYTSTTSKSYLCIFHWEGRVCPNFKRWMWILARALIRIFNVGAQKYLLGMKIFETQQIKNSPLFPSKCRCAAAHPHLAPLLIRALVLAEPCPI